MSRNVWQPTCPAACLPSGEVVTLAHGEGGRLSRRLIQERIAAGLGSPLLDTALDAATLHVAAERLAMTTDSFVVSPLFFPGGDIGSLAVYGTANDLAVSGARPRWLSLSLILEEGLPLSTLDKIVGSIAEAAESAEVAIVTGDTKVVPRGAADALFINTCGLGELVPAAPRGPRAIAPGDVLLVSGPIARHGIAVLAARESLGFDPPPVSDCAPLWPVVDELLRAGIGVRAMRDATRGGVAAVLHEWAAASGVSLLVDEAALPVLPAIRAACELLGMDPLHIANEGTLVAAVAKVDGPRALEVLGGRSPAAAVIGTAVRRESSPVLVRRALGRMQPLDEPLGAPLPRIC